MSASPTTRSERRMAALLLAAVAVVIFWQLMARWSRRGRDPYTDSVERVAGFSPALRGWRLESLPAGNDPLMPVILTYRAWPGDGGSPVLIRLTHGYNMVDCMRIKYFDVTLLADRRETRPGEAEARTGAVPHQLWRLTSDIGDESVWITTMLSAEGFAATQRDTRDMAFPRIGTPDDPNWVPRGLSLSGLKRPIHNLKLWLRARWNASRSDLLTFLRLRQPAYVSREVYTLVTTTALPPGPAHDLEARRAQAAHKALALHVGLYETLRAFAQTAPGPTGVDG